MVDKPYWQWSACDLAAAIAKGDVSATEALESTLSRVEAKNPGLNAIVDDLSQEARADAKKLDEVFKTSGPIGPMHGVPVTIKENIDQKGHATPNGVEAFKDIIAPDDSPVVRNLKNAGAVVIGRTNTPEFSFRGSTDNVLHGRTYNPWNDWASAGGSSGGAGSSVMAGMGGLGHGNDIAGSLRYPSYTNGATSVKPSFGRVPAWNPSQKAERGLVAQLMSVQGVIGREIRDVRLGMESLVAYDPHDPWMVPLPINNPFGDNVAREKPKVAFTKNTFEFTLDKAVEKGLDTARETLVDAGYEVVEIEPPLIREITDVSLRCLFGEVKVMMDADVRKYGSATINKVFDHYYELFEPYEGEDLLRAMAKRSYYVRQWNLFLQDYPLVLCPFMPMATWKWDHDLQGLEGARDLLGAGVYSVSLNFLGLPAGVVSGNYNDGLPTGVQVIGRRYREDMVLDACEEIEQRVGIMAHKLFERG